MVRKPKLLVDADILIAGSASTGKKKARNFLAGFDNSVIGWV